VRAKTAYLDGELCGVGDDGLPVHAGFGSSISFSISCISTAATSPALPLIERKALLEPLVAAIPGLEFNGHETGDGELIRRHAGQLGHEGVVSKTINAPYAPGSRGLWRKSKCLNRQEFVVVGWTEPEGSRPHIGALLLGYYNDDD
jgi:ATP-dependent DNA ligase